MQNCIHSGYSGIYRPMPLIDDNYPLSIYCLSTRLNTCFIIIPLTPLFTKDVIRLAKNTTAKYIYIIAQDFSILNASNYYIAWDYIKHTLHKDCKIFTKFMPENTISQEFKTDIIRNENDILTIDIPRSDIDHGTITISLVKNYVYAANPFTCDIIIDDTYTKKYFISEMNKLKAEYLYDMRGKFDEFHIAYIVSDYGGLTYQQFISMYPAMVSKTFANRFSTYEEYLYAKDRGIKVGNRINTVRW